MPRLIITEGAVFGLERCRKFLNKKNPLASTRAAQTIKHYFSLVETGPEIGRPFEEVDGSRYQACPRPAQARRYTA